jgi:hypothetical protein
VAPNTRVRVEGVRGEQHRLALARGEIAAYIWAPPRRFAVETSSALAVDLGCAYTLSVDAAGRGRVHVTMGWVGFAKDGRESFIPEGAECATRPPVGPGTPYYSDAPAALRASLERLDFERLSARDRDATLARVLEAARSRDAFTLWHLLARTGGAERERVYTRLAALAPPPAGVTPDGVLRGDARMRDLWWNELGLGSTGWWREWEGEWPGEHR